jgi:hypothetical protein
MPDMVTEGIAMVAEYHIKYPQHSREMIRRIFESKVKAENRYYQKIDFNLPFSFYEESDRRYLYSLAGLFVASQGEGVVRSMVYME